MIRFRSVALASFLLLPGAAAHLWAQGGPLITARTPARGPVTGGTTVEVLSNGWFSTFGTTVTIPGAGGPVTGIVVHSPTRLTFVTPRRPALPTPYTVTITSGSFTQTTSFRYVSRTRTGILGARRPVFNYSGQYVAFESRYALVPGDTNGVTDVYVRDRTGGALRRVSVPTGGTQALGGESTRPSISATGRFVAFQSKATNLVPGDTNGLQDIFVHDRDADGDGVFDEAGAVTTERVSLAGPSAGPPPQPNGDSFRPAINGNGRFVAFHSAASNLVGGDANSRNDVFVFDRRTRQTRLMSTNINNGFGDGHSRNSVISLDGRFVAFESLANNLAGGNPGFSDVFLRDRDVDEDGIMDESGQAFTLLVSMNSCEANLTNHAIEPSMTYDGRYIVFSTAAGNAIVNGQCQNLDSNGVLDVFLYDRLGGGLVRRLSQGSNGLQFPGSSGAPVISGNGNLLRFTTQAQNAGGPSAPGVIVAGVDDGKSTTGEVPSPTNPAPPPADVPPPPPTEDEEDPAVSGDGNTTGGTNEPDPGTGEGEPEVEVEEPEPDPAPAPFIAGLSPASGPSTGGNQVEIQGANFIVGQTLVHWNGATIFPIGGTVTPGSLRVVAPPSPGFDGPVTVRVIAGPTGNSQASNEVTYTYATGLSAPTINSFLPTTGFVTGGFPVTISGSGFSAPSVRFGAFAGVVTNATANSITVTAPVVPVAGPVSIVVQNGDGATAVSPAPFTYTFAPVVAPPTIATVVVDHGPVTGGTSITISGTNFAAGATVTVGNVPATDVQVLGNSQIVAVTPSGVPGSATVVVTTTNGSASSSFFYDALAPPVLTCAGSDSDLDGVPDAWELQYGLNPADGSDGALDPDLDGLTNLQECTALTHPRGMYSRYLAEGATGTFFDTRVIIANPGVTPARILFRFLASNGVTSQVVRHFLEMPGESRRTIDVRQLPGLAAMDISAVIETDVQIVVDRTMRWDQTTRAGAHAESSAPAPSLTWYLAEGATHGNFDLFYLLQNPSQTQTAQVQIRYLLPAGSPLVQALDLAPNSRTTIYVDQQAGLSSTDVSGVITSVNGVPIIAERAMYSSATGVFAAGHDSVGVTSPSLAWFFAEGATGGFFDTFLLFANPNGSPAEIQATYLLPSGQTVVKPYTLPANSRTTVNVQLEDPQLAATAVSAQVVSTNGVSFLAERSMWWPHGQAWTEAHNAAGATATGTKWAVADGEAGTLPDDTATFLLVANTSAFAGTVRVTLLFETGAPVFRQFAVPGNSRFNVPILTTDVPDSPVIMRVPRGTRFSAVVESVGVTPAQIVVERAMYWNANGQLWAAGSDLLATKLQ